jgi:hypothetical protein
MKIKIIKPDGTKAEMEIEGSLDFQGMGVLAPDEVTALKTRALNEGKTAAEKAAQEKLDAAEKKLADFESSLTEKQRGTVKAEERIAAMEATIKSMRADMEAAQKASAEANLAKSLADARAGIAFADGGAEVFDMQMQRKRQSDGTYILATGERGTLEQARAEWLGSAVGKSLVKADQRNGAGTGPSNIQGVTFAQIVADPKLKAAYVEQHGAARYSAEYTAHIRAKSAK